MRSAIMHTLCNILIYIKSLPSSIAPLILFLFYILGLRMRMMPRAAPSAMVDGARGAGVRRCSFSIVESKEQR